MSTQTDLYRYYDESDILLYVGISKSAVARACQHQGSSHWYSKHKSIETERFDTREEALAAEEKAIKSEHPLYNKIHNGNMDEGTINCYELNAVKMFGGFDWMNEIKKGKTISLMAFILTKMDMRNVSSMGDKWFEDFCNEIDLHIDTKEAAAKTAMRNLLKTDLVKKVGKNEYFINPYNFCRSSEFARDELIEKWSTTPKHNAKEQ